MIVRRQNLRVFAEYHFAGSVGDRQCRSRLDPRPKIALGEPNLTRLRRSFEGDTEQFLPNILRARSVGGVGEYGWIEGHQRSPIAGIVEKTLGDLATLNDGPGNEDRWPVR